MLSPYYPKIIYVFYKEKNVLTINLLTLSPIHEILILSFLTQFNFT